MTNNIKDAIIALRAGESSTFKDIINNELINKAMDAINIEKIKAGQSFFGQSDIEPEVNSDEEV